MVVHGVVEVPFLGSANAIVRTGPPVYSPVPVQNRVSPMTIEVVGVINNGMTKVPEDATMQGGAATQRDMLGQGAMNVSD